MQLEESRLNQASRLSQAMKERKKKKMGRVRKVKKPIEISATQGLEDYRYGIGYANKDGSGKGNCE